MFKYIGLFAAALTISACQVDTQGGQAAQFASGQIATDAQMAPLYGRTLTYTADNTVVTVVIQNANTFSGALNGNAFAGTYDMRGGYFCRTITSGAPEQQGQEDCQLWVQNGSAITGTRDRGNGASFTYIVS